MVATTWNPADKGSGVTLSGSNLVAAGDGSARATASKSTPFYYEIVVDALPTSVFYFGVDNGGTATQFGVRPGGANKNGITGSLGSGGSGTTAYDMAIDFAYEMVGAVNGSVIGVAADPANNRMWLRLDGVWIGSGTQNPATGSGGVTAVTDVAKPWFPWVTLSVATVTGRFNEASFRDASPSGFPAFDAAADDTPKALGSFDKSGWFDPERSGKQEWFGLNRRREGWFDFGLIAAATAGALPVGRADETDAALALGSARPVGLATGTNTAFALAAVQIRAAVRADETDAALTLAGVQIRATGNALETDTARALGSARPAGLATEADTALALAAVQARATGRADETDTALALGAARPVGLSTGTNTALALAGVQIRAVGLALETDAAQALTPLAVCATGRADEADAALALARVQVRATGLASETDAALALAAKLIGATGRANETDEALALGSGASAPVGRANETDTALALASLQTRLVGVALEADQALALAGVQVRAVGVASETDAALALGAAIAVPVGAAVEADQALALGAVLIREAGLAAESDVALFLAGMQALDVGLATEADEALALLDNALPTTFPANRIVRADARDNVTEAAPNRDHDAQAPNRPRTLDAIARGRVARYYERSH